LKTEQQKKESKKGFIGIKNDIDMMYRLKYKCFEQIQL